MKKIAIQTRSIVQLQKLLCSFLLLGSAINGAYAQNSQTDIIPPGSTITKLSTNQFIFIEGPVWYRDSVLLFTDGNVNPNKIYSYNPSGNQFSVFRNNSAGCNGLTCDKDGNLLGCESSRVVMMNDAGAVTESFADIYNGSAFNGPNDLIADDKGGVYFTDPIFNIHNQDKSAVYYIDSTGNVTRIIDELSIPNGIILSRDGTRLFVVDSHNKYVYSWDVASDGSISGKSNFAVLQTLGGIASAADGMAIDINGNIYVATDKGIQVFSSQGEAITIIEVPEKPSNCDFGGTDFKTLYITARTNIYSIELNYPGYTVSRKTLPNGINSIPDKLSVDMYPNPVHDVLNFSLPGKSGIAEVFDVSGKLVFNKEFGENNSYVDVSRLVKGIYFVKLSSDNQLFTGIFVKH